MADDGCLEGAPPFLRRRIGLVVPDGYQADPGARGALAELSEVDPRDDGQHRVAPERGVVGQEDDGFTAGGHLHRPGDHALGVELTHLGGGPAQCRRGLGGPQPDSDTVALRLDD